VNITNNTTTQPAPLPHPAIRAILTLLPLAFYLIALQINIPSYRHALGVSTASYEAHTVAAVGLLPWFTAAIAVKIFGNASRTKQDSAISRADLYRLTTFIGLGLAVIHSAWIVFVWTDFLLVFFHVGVFDPAALEAGEKYYYPGISSPILAFASLIGSAILFKILIDLSLSRSFLHKNGRVLAIVALLPIVYSLVTTPLDSWLRDLTSIACGVVCLLQCGVLIAFALLNPEFFARDAKS
jgi:hypothetical protein